MPGEGKTPRAVNALVPPQAGTRVGSQIPKAAALFPALPIPALAAQNILDVRMFGGGSLRVGAALRIRPNLGEAGEAEPGVLGF